jgi:hypothetical protein
MLRTSRGPRGSGSQRGALTTGTLLLTATFVAISAAACAVPPYDFPTPNHTAVHKSYVCYRTAEPVTADGVLDEAAWAAAPWTDAFVDIEGDVRPAPRFETRAKMLWDDDYFYVAAEMAEPHVWAKLTDRDAVIFYDNDFEVFIDPDSDTQEYYELEINAFGTEWDLLLTKPYRDGGTAIDSWDIQGLVTGIDVRGTLNDPSDTDEGWSVELAIPWKVLEECAHKATPPKDGDHWRVNFSRVEWRTEVVDGDYVKVTDPETGKPLPEDNWVWSPQGLVNMHYPEMWGYVQFSTAAPGEGGAAFKPDPEHDARAALMKLYYAQRTHFGNRERYAASVEELDLETHPGGSFVWPPEIHVTPGSYEASLVTGEGKTLRVSHDGHIW